HADRPSVRVSRRSRGELPRQHLHPPRCRRDARAACTPAPQQHGQGRHPHLPLARPRDPARALERGPPRARLSGRRAALGRAFGVAGETERIALLAETLGLSAHKAERLLRAISREKRTQSWAGAEVTEARGAYARARAWCKLIAFADLR